MFLGIDLGTTNTVVSRSFVDSDGKLFTEVVQMGQVYNDNWDKFTTLPSMVYKAEDDDLIVGREAKRQREYNSERVIANSKRFMGTNHVWKIDKESYEAKDVAAIILQHCKKTIENEANMRYDTVVITVPASFNPDQIEDTLRAAKQAGFDDEKVVIKHEPTAALLSFIDSELKKGKTEQYIDFSETKRIMVFDLGGGTCDTSIIDVKIDNGDLFFTEVGIGRYQELGGIDFDAKLAECLLNDYFKENNILEGDVSIDEKDILYKKILIAAEAIKERLSAKISNKMLTGSEHDIEDLQINHNIPGFYMNKPYRITINKNRYDQYTHSLYMDKDVHYKKFEDMDRNKSIISVIRKTLEDYDIKKASIDYIFMAGGMSQFITVKQKIKEFIGKPLISPENPMDAVARGASIYQHYKVKENKKEKPKGLGESNTNEINEGIVDTMMLAEAVLLDMNEGLPEVIIPKKTIVPYTGEIKGVFKTSSPSGIKLNIYAAEHEMDSSMRIQKCIEKSFTFPVKSGTPFDIKYTINENKAINMQLIVNDGIHLQELDVSIRSDLKISEKNYNIVIE